MDSSQMYYLLAGTGITDNFNQVGCVFGYDKAVDAARKYCTANPGVYVDVCPARTRIHLRRPEFETTDMTR